MKKPKTLTKLKKELDDIFSLYIRLKYADSNGMVACYTSGAVKHWKEMHCGHFISRRHLATRWDESNCRPQTPAENLFNQGNAPAFAQRLMKEYGEGIIDALIEKCRHPVKLIRADYEEMIDHYKGEVNKLKINLEI